MAKSKREARQRRKVRIRQKIKGTAERPRLTIYRSLRHVSVQVVDDVNNRVIAVATTVGKTAQADMDGLKKVEQSKKIGARVAELCKTKGVGKVVFDRNGYRYHGRVRALADAARAAGLVF